MDSRVNSVLVIGAGFMGAGIAQVCIQKGIQTVLSDTDNGTLIQARENIRLSLEKLSAKGRLEQSPEHILTRLETIVGLETKKDPSWVIEAIFEDESLKKELLIQIEEKFSSQTLIATNTSSFPVSLLASHLKYPDRFLGLHFFGPVLLMDLVEVVKGSKTSEQTFLKGMAFIEALGKYPVGVKKDLPGFVMNRIFAAAFRECQELLSQGVVSVEDIDAGMRLGYGWRAGPFEISDNAGLDTVLQVKKSMKSLGEIHLYSDTDVIDSMVEKGFLGRKSGRGFYKYNDK